MAVETSFDEVSKLIKDLNNAETYSNNESIKKLTDLCRIVGDRRSRPEICRHLTKLDFEKIAFKILVDLKYENEEHENIEIRMPLGYIYSILLNSTDLDAVLCSKYMDAGVIELVKKFCCYIQALPEKTEDILEILSLSVRILSNISRVCPIKEKCGGSVDWLIPMLSIKNSNINISSMMLLSHLVDDNNNEVLLDDIGNIGYIVKFIEYAYESEDRRHDGFTLVELLSAVGNLAKNSFNREQLKTCELLELMVRLLENNDENIQELALNIMLTMLLDNKILTCYPPSFFESLRTISENLNRCENFLIKTNSESVLKLIDSTWLFP